MIKIFSQNATKFDTLGLGTLVPITCPVTEQLNDVFQLTMTHPYDEWGKWKRIEINNIIVAPTPRGLQPFRIYSVSPNMEDIEVKARHLFYDLLNNMVLSFNPPTSEVNGQVFLNLIESQAELTMPFIFDSDMPRDIEGKMAWNYQNVVELLLSTDENVTSFVNNYGGEILRDGFNVTMKPSIGSDNGVVIAYKKNLTGLSVTEDISSMATRIYPVGQDGLKLTGDGYIDSPYVNDYPYPIIAKLDVSNATTQAELTAAVNDFFAAGGDLPLVNIEVTFADLSQTIEYEKYKVLETVNLGDTVTIRNDKMGFSKQAKVISYEYDAILQKYEKIELGEFMPLITQAITIGANSGSVAVNAQSAAASVSQLINNVATITSNGLYICIDTNNINTATKMFWFGQNGLQYRDTTLSADWVQIVTPEGFIPQDRIQS